MVQVLLTRKIFIFKHILKLVYKYIIAATLMLICLLFVDNLLPVGIIFSIIELIVGTFLYIAILILLKDSSIYELINKLKRR